METTAINTVKSSILPKKQTPLVPPFSKKEILARIAQSEKDSAAGLGQESEEMFRELQEEFAREDYELEMAEAV